jgi:excinuclease ABC subunit A
VELGPDGGDRGGRLLVEGPPEQVAACADSHTGRFLRDALAPFPTAAGAPVRRRRSPR